MILIDEQPVERPQRVSKRYADGLPKNDTNGTDSLSNVSSSSVNNQTTVGGTHLKKNKTSHVQEKTTHKQEPLTMTSTTVEKNESSLSCNMTSTNDLDNKTHQPLLSTTNQPKKEKPTAK